MLDDFRRLFGESGSFDQMSTQSVADTNEELEEIYGSIKDYFAYVSKGAQTFNVEILSPPHTTMPSRSGLLSAMNSGTEIPQETSRSHSSWGSVKENAR